MSKLLAKAQTRLTKRLETLREKEEGATAVEYGLIVALIAAVIVGVVLLLGQDILRAFQTVVNAI